ncbi:MAG: hypothetical protein NZU63_14310 [Gemmataceae bacterium]|nr:hypothetical protein [Gemmataceae bacterium]MDW8244486.1 hypothetical protein [Thermogemmata sp.]
MGSWEESGDAPSAAGLPATVIIGLALLPFGIPLFWLIGPVLTGTSPPVSLVTAVALAVSASILCLSIIYTIDWTAETRLKGVVILIVLAYFGGMTLYFTDKATLERLYRLGKDVEWREFQPDRGPVYRVKVPAFARPEPTPAQPLPLAELHCYHLRVPQDLFGWHMYVMGAGEPKQHPELPGSDGWFDAAQKTILSDGGQLRQHFVVPNGFLKGRQWEIELPENGKMRVIRIYVGRGKVYYLSVEGDQINAHHQDVERFFRSFFIPQANPEG